MGHGPIYSLQGPSQYPVIAIVDANGEVIDPTGSGTSSLRGTDSGDAKLSVLCVTVAALPTNTRTGNVLTASANGAFPAIDGVTLVAGDRFLVKNEVVTVNNGWYTLTYAGNSTTQWTATRATDADTSAEVTEGAYSVVTGGTVNRSTTWVLISDDPITLNTTALVFAQLDSTEAGMLTGANLWTGTNIFAPTTDIKPLIITKPDADSTTNLLEVAGVWRTPTEADPPTGSGQYKLIVSSNGGLKSNAHITLNGDVATDPTIFNIGGQGGTYMLGIKADVAAGPVVMLVGVDPGTPAKHLECWEPTGETTPGFAIGRKGNLLWSDGAAAYASQTETAFDCAIRRVSNEFVFSTTSSRAMVWKVNTVEHLRIDATQVLIQPSAVGNIGLTVKALASQTASLQEWQDSAGVMKTKISATGIITAPTVNAQYLAASAGGGVFTPVLFDVSGALGLYMTTTEAQLPKSTWLAASASTIPLGVRAAASQTASMQEWRNNSNGILSRIGAAGRFMTRVASAPALGDMVDNELALSLDASGNLVVTSRIAGALKTGTVIVA